MASEMKLPLNDRGYVTHWLVSGPSVHPFSDTNDQVDQLAFEAKLRALVRDTDITAPPGDIRVDAPFHEMRPWRYHDMRGNWFVELSSPGSGLKKVDASAACLLHSDKTQAVDAILWTYAAIDLWVNGQKCLEIPAGAYKPVIKRRFTLPLLQGENSVFVRMQALAVRDTHNVFGLQLPGAQGITVALPDAEHSMPPVRAAQWLDSVSVSDGSLYLSSPPYPAQLETNGQALPITGEMRWPAGGAESVTVSIQAGGQTLRRRLEFPENIRPVYLTPANPADNTHRYYEMIGKHAKIPRGPDTYFAGYQILARYATDSVTGLDYDLIYNDLDVIEARKDCSEFIAVALLRLAHRYDLGETARREIRRVFLGYRYWMDEPGEDGMCFWSENHALMFFGTQLVAGALYPDDVFTRSGRTGREQYAIARARCNDWLDDVLAHGFEEFLSANYVPVTLGALVNLIDFGPPEIQDKATRVLDEQLLQLALHTFQSVVIAPQGRVYREVLDPFRQDFQGILNYFDGSTPYVDSWWLSALATSGYRFPADKMRSLMAQDADTTYDTGNARVVVHKRAACMLTSVQSPSGQLRKWANEYNTGTLDPGSNAYVKALNEKFHGTSCFTPGQYGYQQHMAYAALGPGAVLFTNHPGTPSDGGASRPGYWHGNGVMPAQKQENGLLGQIYTVDDAHPVDFVHLYLPQARFDEVRTAGAWRFARKGDGYAAVWCSEALVPYDDVRAGCEWRANSRRAAFVIAVASAKTHGDLSGFMAACEALTPTFDPDALTLTAGDAFRLAFDFARDDTQTVP